MKLVKGTSVVLLGLVALSSCTSHLKRDPSSVSSCNLYIENLDHVVELTDAEKSNFINVAKKNEWNMVFNKSDLREGDHMLSGLIESHLQKKLSFRSNYVYFIPYELKVEKSYTPQVTPQVLEVAFNHPYELKTLELSSAYGLKGRTIASQSFKKSYPSNDKMSPFYSQFENHYFDMGQLEGGSLTSSKWAKKDSMIHFFKDVVSDLPKCTDI